MPNKDNVPNQMFRELQDVNGLIPFPGAVASSRKQMFASHIGQTLVVKGSTERSIQTGMEREFGKYTYNVKMPCNAHIIKVIDRYRPTMDKNAIKHNPQTVVIYENVDTKQIGMLTLQGYCSYHQYFGFEYKNKPAIAQLRAGAYIAAGTILQDSPSITDDGGYKYGVECNMVFLSMPGVSEDGIIVSRDILPRFRFKIYETRVVEFGSRRFPLNLYGDKDNYKPFPDIGDVIRDDGALMGLRSYDENLTMVEQSVEACMKIDHIYDKITYVNGAGGRIVDIRAHHELDAPNIPTPSGMEVQAERYDAARRVFYSDILQTVNLLRKQRGAALQLSEELHRMTVEAISVVGDVKGKRIMKTYRQAPMDDWRLEFVIEYEVTPTIGFKMTDTFGGKGVICKIAEPHEMPVDEDGNRADIIMDPGSRISRMIPASPYELYFNAARRDVGKKIMRDVGLEPNDSRVSATFEAMEKNEPVRFNALWDYLIEFYAIISPRMALWFRSGEYKKARWEHMSEIYKRGIFVYFPTENDPELEDIVKELEKHYRPTYGPVTYIGNSGLKRTTKQPVRIGPVYMILLEKTADDWTAVSSGKLQHFGVLAQVTNSDKFSQPTRNNPVRALGEAEARIYISYAGARVTADIMDRNNNPRTHKLVVRSILGADQPTNIACAVDRQVNPIGGSKPHQLINHIGECGGWRFVYRPYVDTADYYRKPQKLVE